MKKMIFSVVMSVWPMLSVAQTMDDARFLELIGIDRLVGVMSLEGLADGQGLPEEAFGVLPGEGWTAMLERIYDVDAMRDATEQAFLEAFDNRHREEVEEFVASDAWQNAIDLEVAARMALLDPEVEEMVYDNAERDSIRNGNRARKIRRLIREAEMLEYNLESNLNSMLAFYLGMADSGVPIELSDEELYAMIMSDQDEVEQDIREWLFAVLMMAYDPLSERHLDQQIEFWQTREGTAFNDALFQAFDELFAGTSYELGKAAAQVMNETAL